MNLVSDNVQTSIVLDLIEPSLIDLGYEIVRVRLTGDDRVVLQVMIDKTDLAEVTVEDCKLVSNTISTLLDVEDPISTPYELEVSSPGLDRPLTRTKHFQSYIGSNAKLELKTAMDGRRRFKGRLLGIEENNIKIMISVDSKEVEVFLPFEAIDKANIIIPDELFTSVRREQGN